METGVSCLVMLAQCWDGTRLDRCPLQRLWVANGLSSVLMLHNLNPKCQA